MKRDNEFWDAVEANGALPAAAATLGWELINAGEGTVEVAFTADDRFLNPAGVIQGGFLAAMLDDTLGPALVSTLERGQFAPTADLHVQFLRPARPGRLTGRGRIVRRGKSVAFLSGELSDSDGRVVAVATATAVVQDGVIGERQLHGRQAKVGAAEKTGLPSLARWVERGRPGRPGTRSYSTPLSEPMRPGAALADLNWAAECCTICLGCVQQPFPLSLLATTSYPTKYHVVARRLQLPDNAAETGRVGERAVDQDNRGGSPKGTR